MPIFASLINQVEMSKYVGGGTLKKYINSSPCGETASSLRYDRWELTWNVLLCMAQSRTHICFYDVLYENVNSDFIRIRCLQSIMDEIFRTILKIFSMTNSNGEVHSDSVLLICSL